MHNRRHNKSPTMDLSLWLPGQHDANDEDLVTVDAISHIVESKQIGVKCTVSKLGSVYVDPSGRMSQAFRIQYDSDDGEAILPFADAKIMHEELHNVIPAAFPGAECR